MSFLKNLQVLMTLHLRAFWLANVKYKGLQVGEIFSQLLFATCSLAVPLAWLTGLRGSLFLAYLLARLFCLARSACLLPRRFVILSFRQKAKIPKFLSF